MDEGDRIPSEFLRYWEELDRPSVRRLRSAFRALAGFDPLPAEETVLDLAHGYYDADPVAEAFVDEVYLGRGTNEGRRMLDQAIREGVEAVDGTPPSMVALFDEFERDPGWLDRDLVERGATLFRRYGPSVFSFAGAETLLAYTESSVAKPLALTGAYAGDTALHRFMETSRFWIDVSEPGGLDPGGPGRATAMRVRVMHVFVRRRLMAHPEWDLDAWGVPISQSDALMTLMAGSFTPGLAMHALGYVTTPADIRALMHYWRYIGHLLGVQPRHYPQDVREAFQFSVAYFLKRSFTAGRDGVELIESYPAAFRPESGTPAAKRLRDEVNYRMQVGYTRYFLPGFYRRYDMPFPWPWAMLPAAQIPFNLIVELLARRSSRVAGAQDRWARWRRATWFRNEMGDKPAEFRAAEVFTR